MNRKNLLIIILFILAVLVIILGTSLTRKTAKIDQKKESPISISGFVNQAKELEAKADFIGAKSIYQRLISEFPSSPEVINWQKDIENLNIKLLFSPTLTPHSVYYQIKPGDTLYKIAKKFKTTVDLIMKSNGLSSNKIIPGRKIKVWIAPFNIVIDKSQNTLILKAQEEVIKTYTVATGVNNSTPTGTFKIKDKLLNPTWFKVGAVVPPDSPENILGSRWLGFDLPGYGIHGTTEPQSLGKQTTKGCVRMSNSDIEELYTIIPEGTEVTIID
ncbi:MAG: L,D-transpeptidase family protein [Candidatus Omnitrophica bacterium]|nr:L,D-transpeptidase family protein [Candidatus Omnitrophota bacterium]